MTIRPALAEHLAAIPAIELAGARLFSERDLPQHLRHRVSAQSDLRDAMDERRLWVALTDGQTVGFAMADVIDGEAYLTEVDVLPAYGRRGIGSRLVSTVKDWGRAGGFAHLTLVTFRHVPWNAPFYEKLGFARFEPAEHGPELRRLFREERKAGIKIRDRIAMRIKL